MAYLTLAEAKTYLGLNGTADDTLITELLGAAQGAIDRFCDRTFAAAADTTRTLRRDTDTDGRFLYLNGDLCQLTSVVNDATGAAQTVVPTAFRLLPQEPPHLVLRLYDDAGLGWAGEITITGRWAFSITPPESVAQAAREYLAFLYRQPASRAPQRPEELPVHIVRLLEPFQRAR